MKSGLIIDCFAGGGGASVGIEMALGRQVDIAVNHDPDAILMHRTNHPDTLHLTEDIFKVDLQKYVKGQKVALMWASPDCTSHSKAKGGQPRNRGLRILPWAVYKHAKAIRPDVIIMENVEEIQKWGPLDDNGRPIKEREGEDYQKFINAMKGLGYQFDSRELVAADYGAPTTRRRWYAIFRKDGREIIWPEPTHAKGAAGGLKPWEECGQTLSSPLGTITTKDRFGLVSNVVELNGEEYILNDIFLRMLKPEELKIMQGFPPDYIIDRDINFKRHPVKEQVARIGNSVVPIMAQKLVEANCSYLKIGERIPNMRIDDSKEQLRFA